jgi:hypothetical protein
MDPIVKRRKYVEIDASFQTRKELTLKNHANKIDIYKDTIELLFYLSDILNARIYEDTKVSGKPLSGPKALIPILYDRNNHYLIAAYKLTSNCLINPAYLNLRVVFETIAKMYLLHLTGKEADLFYKSQLSALSVNEEEEFKSKYRWLGPKTVRNTLYSDEKKLQINDFYKQISNSAHPSIKSAMSDFEYRDETVTDALHLTLALSSANMIVIHETYFDKFNEEEETEITNTLVKIAKELGGFMIDMIPNNPNLKKKPKIVL